MYDTYVTYIHIYLTSPCYSLQRGVLAFTVGIQSKEYVSQKRRHNLIRIVRTAEKFVGVSLPQLQDIYTECCVQRAGSILKDCTHPFYGLFSLMQSGKRYRSIKTKTTWLLNSFLPTSIRLLNQRFILLNTFRAF